MTKSRRCLAVGALLAAAASASACTSGSSPTSSHTLRRISCPADVELQLVRTHACFTLHVSEDRQHPSGRQVSLFVLRLTPPGPTSRDPMLVLGTDLGDTPGYGGMTALPERVHRVTYIVDARGTGHSTPLQTCPEASKVTALSSDETAALATASQHCLTRLRAAGDDPSLFGPDDVTADIIELRQALGISRWNVITFGSTSIYAGALVARDTAAIRSLIEDSPSPAPTDSSTRDLDAAWRQLTAECRADDPCHRAFPRVGDLLREASARVRHRPLHVAGGSIDAAVLAQIVRNMLAGEGPTGPAELPAALTSLIRGRVPTTVIGALRRDTAACIGYRAECTPSFSLGAFLTATCALEDSSGVDVRRQACRDWPHASAPSGSSSLVPTLIVFGALDPYVDAHALLAMPSGNGTFVVRVPHQTHNALGFDDCPIAMRNAWVDQLDVAPPTDCFAGMRPVPFVTR